MRLPHVPEGRRLRRCLLLMRRLVPCNRGVLWRPRMRGAGLCGSHKHVVLPQLRPDAGRRRTAQRAQAAREHDRDRRLAARLPGDDARVLRLWAARGAARGRDPLQRVRCARPRHRDVRACPARRARRSPRAPLAARAPARAPRHTRPATPRARARHAGAQVSPQHGLPNASRTMPGSAPRAWCARRQSQPPMAS